MSEPIDPHLEARLSAALDGVRPRTPDPAAARYSGRLRGRLGLLRPALAALAAAALVAGTALAATGSANPAVWTQRALGGVQGAGHSNVRSSPSPEGSRHEAQGAGASPTSGRESPKPTHAPGAKETPEPNEGPGDGDGDGDGEHATPTASASPTPDGGDDHDHGGSSPSPSPSPSGD